LKRRGIKINKFLYRDHRGSLEASMETVQEMESFADLKNHIEKIYGSGEITIKLYCYDSRIDWDSHIVCINGNAVGFTNGQCTVLHND